MQDRTVLCRRLGQAEVADWLSLPHDNPKVAGDDARLTWFLRLPKSISYVSSIADQRVGGTIVYHNNLLHDLALVSVRLDREFRGHLLFQLIKSSLPWFRSQSIESVTALVNPEASEHILPFPLRSGIPSWVNNSLKQLGFKTASGINHYVFPGLEIQNDSKSSEYEVTTSRSHGRTFDPGSKQDRHLIHTHFVPMISLSPDVTTVHALSQDSEVVAVGQIMRIEERIILGPIEWKVDEINIDVLAQDFLAYLSRRELRNLELAMIPPEQKEFVEAIKRSLGVQPEVNEYTVFRKIL
ncbi:MAG: hypothetical protein R6V83_04125 [Candidatus Thorarchaeota archaeon]